MSVHNDKENTPSSSNSAPLFVMQYYRRSDSCHSNPSTRTYMHACIVHNKVVYKIVVVLAVVVAWQRRTVRTVSM